jgi:hypothetical protein
LGPGLIAAIEVAGKGVGSVVVLCTDGLANVGVGTLDPLTEESVKFYEELGQIAKGEEHNRECDDHKGGGMQDGGDWQIG